MISVGDAVDFGGQKALAWNRIFLTEFENQKHLLETFK